MDRTAAWSSFLDTLESELQGVHRAMERQRLRPQPDFVPPRHLGPLPAELATRASEVLDHIRTTEDQVRAEMQRASRQIKELRTVSARAPRTAAAFDLKA